MHDEVAVRKEFDPATGCSIDTFFWCSVLRSSRAAVASRVASVVELMKVT